MALPSLLKTWEYRTNVPSWGGTNTYDSVRHLALDIKNLLTDTEAHGYKDGSFVDVGGGIYAIQGITQFTAVVGMIGKTVKVRGSTSSGNDGDFTITAVPGPSEIRFANASGVAESVNGSVNVIGGNFTTLPWVLDHTVVPPAASWIGAAADGIDAFRVYTDWQSDTVAFTQVVLRNTVTGTYWIFTGDTSSNSFRERGVIKGITAPGSVVASGSLSANPTGDLVTSPEGQHNQEKTFNGNTSAWYAGDTGGSISKLNLMVTDDGQHTRIFSCIRGFVPLFWFDETVLNPHPQWATGPTPVVTGMRDASSVAHAATIAAFNDSAFLAGSKIPTAVLGQPDRHTPDLYMTAEGYSTALAAENIVVKNELTGEWPLYPIGLLSNEIGYKSRIGQLKDMWYTSTGTVGGEFFPNDTSRQFVNIGDVVLPWNGDLIEWS